MRIVTWNFERHHRASWQAQGLLERIREVTPDVICLTEAFENSLADLGGSTISTAGVIWSPVRPDERKVVLWSRNPWQLDELDAEAIATGACVSGVTETQLGSIRVVGVCIPYHFASPLGMSPRARPWAQQITFLNNLGPLLRRLTQDGRPTILVGDYNRYVPRIWGSKAASEALASALAGFVLATTGTIPNVERPAIDHIAHTLHIRALAVSGLDERVDDGRVLSDHFGLSVDFASAAELT